MHINTLLDQYGYIVLYISLTLELIAVPMPGEILMTYCGFLIYQRHLNWGISIVVAALGVMTGITISYIAGSTLGFAFFKRYGSYLHMTPERFEKVSVWFERYGGKLLIAAYFIPGVRHITGYFSGITKIHYKRFSISAYCGALIWTSTFISLGKILGPDWEKFHGYVKKYLIIGGAVIIIILSFIYLYRTYKEPIKNLLLNKYERAVEVFHSLGRIKFAIAAVSVGFLVMFVISIGFIQDYYANEFYQFDTVVGYIIKLIITEDMLKTIRTILYLSDYRLMLIMLLIPLSVIIMMSKDKKLDLKFLIIVPFGGAAFENILLYLFNVFFPKFLGLKFNISRSFPGGHSLMAVIVYGYTAYIIIRHINMAWIKVMTTFSAVLVCIITGFALTLIGVNRPSDIIAGYTFGSAWLLFNIVLLEVYRALRRIQV